jgi:hypothetical protein
MEVLEESVDIAAGWELALEVDQKLEEAFAVQGLFWDMLDPGPQGLMGGGLPVLALSVYSRERKLRTEVYSHDLSKRRRAFIASSAASYRFADALQAFLRWGCESSSSSRFFSVDRLCQMEIETKGAHSLRTMAQSRLWKANMTNSKTFVRIVQESESSRVMDRARRNRSAKSAGRSLKRSRAVSGWAEPAARQTHPMSPDALAS